MPKPYSGLLPSGRPISFASVQNEFGGLPSITMSTYYTQGGVATTSSTISLSNFYGKSSTTWFTGELYYAGGFWAAPGSAQDFSYKEGTKSWYFTTTGESTGAGIEGGRLWVWGDGQWGSLGLGNTLDKSTITQVGALTTWRSVSMSDDSYTSGITAAIRTDNTLWTSGGYPYDGELLGIGTTIPRSAFVQVTGTNWAYVTTNAFASVAHAIRTDGTLWGWGSDAGSFAPLGTNTGLSYSSPVQIGTATDWKFVQSNGYQSSGIKTDGTLWYWGENGSGPGPGVLGHAQSPLPSNTGNEWYKISVGMWHGAGIKMDGTLWTWGRSDYGELGYAGATGNVSSPVQIGSFTSWEYVACGMWSTVAINLDGDFYTCGQEVIYQFVSPGATSVLTASYTSGDPTKFSWLSSGSHLNLHSLWNSNITT